jgi:hypothetical protein
MRESWEAYARRHKLKPATDERVDFVRSRVWMGSIPSDEAGSLIFLIDHLRERVEESDHLLWVMSQDQEAYLRGKDDGRGQYAEWVGHQIRSWFGGEGWFDHHARTEGAFKTLTFLGTEHPPPMPPDRMRGRISELEDVVRELLLAYQNVNIFDQERAVGNAKRILNESV